MTNYEGRTTTKRAIMKKAWKIYRELEGGDRRARFSVALKQAWAECKSVSFFTAVKNYAEALNWTVTLDGNTIVCDRVVSAFYGDYKEHKVSGKAISGSYNSKTKTIDMKQHVVLTDALERTPTCILCKVKRTIHEYRTFENEKFIDLLLGKID